MAATDTKIAIAQIATQVQSIGQARAALGTVTQVLQEGYTRLDAITSIGGERDAAKDLLNQTNDYAQRIYAIWNDDPDLQDEAISTVNALKVATCLEQARTNVRLVEGYAEEEFWNFAQLLRDSITNAVQLAKDAGSVVADVVRIPLTFGAAILQGLWPWILVLGGIVFFYFWARKRALKALVSNAR